MSDLPEQLQMKFVAASNWAIALGTVFLVSSSLQIIGYFPRELGWLNFGVAILVIVLGALAAARPSPIPLLLLCVLFFAIIVDTMIATQYVLNQFGVLAAGLMLVRYAILVAAARAMGQALVGLFEHRRIVASEARIQAAKSAAAATAREPATRTADVSSRSSINLAPSPNPTVPLLVFMAVMLLFGSVVMAAVMPWRNGGAIFAVVMLAAAVGSLYASNIEKKYLPGLVSGLRQAAANNDKDTIRQLAEKLVALKGRASRDLAVAMLAQPKDEAFVTQALAIIKQIGVLDQDAATALRLQFDSAAEVLQAIDRKPQASASASNSATGGEGIPPAHAGHSAFVELMRRTQQEMGASVIVRGLGIIPIHGCDLSLAGFLNNMQAHREPIEEAARARPFDDDEYWVATFGDQVVITTKAFYKLGGLPEYILLRDIERAENPMLLTKNQLNIHMCDGTLREVRLKWSTGSIQEIIDALTPPLAADYVDNLREVTREHRSRNAKLSG